VRLHIRPERDGFFGECSDTRVDASDKRFR
jgi:hypothetical protein